MQLDSCITAALNQKEGKRKATVMTAGRNVTKLLTSCDEGVDACSHVLPMWLLPHGSIMGASLANQETNC